MNPAPAKPKKRIENSGADWTLVRCSVFSQNFSESFDEAIRYGHLAMPVAADTREPFVDAEDIADVVFAALTDDRHIGQLYELTGPRLLTMSEAIQEISRAAGHEVQYSEISVNEYAQGLAEVGFAASEAPLLAKLISEVLDGRNGYLTDGVERALGRQPRDFGDYAHSAADLGAWKMERMAS